MDTAGGCPEAFPGNAGLLAALFVPDVHALLVECQNLQHRTVAADDASGPAGECRLGALEQPDPISAREIQTVFVPLLADSVEMHRVRPEQSHGPAFCS